MENIETVDTNNSLILTIDEIHLEDGWYKFKDAIIGKEFDAFLTTSSVGHPGWWMVVGCMVEKTGVEEIDGCTKEKPMVISMARYSL